MSKYIDVEKLKDKIEFWLNVYSGPNRVVCGGIEDAISQDGRAAMCEDILTEIHSLQQEQAEVDLEEEVKKYFGGLWPGMETAEQCNTDMHFTPPAIMRLAEYFYELGRLSNK